MSKTTEQLAGEFLAEIEAAIDKHAKAYSKAVHAIVVPRAGVATLSAESIVMHCRTLIAGYKCPRSIDLRDEPLPLSSVNKVDKAVLREPFWKDPRQVN
jgi:acyl-CoA synthetase (AMP-forming)/AMP-acid ligase II